MFDFLWLLSSNGRAVQQSKEVGFGHHRDHRLVPPAYAGRVFLLQPIFALEVEGPTPHHLITPTTRIPLYRCEFSATFSHTIRIDMGFKGRKALRISAYMLRRHQFVDPLSNARRSYACLANGAEHLDTRCLDVSRVRYLNSHYNYLAFAIGFFLCRVAVINSSVLFLQLSQIRFCPIRREHAHVILIQGRQSSIHHEDLHPDNLPSGHLERRL